MTAFLKKFTPQILLRKATAQALHLKPFSFFTHAQKKSGSGRSLACKKCNMPDGPCFHFLQASVHVVFLFVLLP
ncbi:hypothetical protein [Niabella ginsenosidivorans]|uniref:hypothetical protein n=1 Tax=Niabella ginsenosidivorans TaxID=1176587 RepID=UPI0012EE055D|nr:hypothetical protein [Niabella ginsenosidivorans]